MTTAEKIELLEETMELEAGTLREDTVLEELDRWNSLTKLSIIVMMDDEFDKEIKSDDIKDYITVADILKAME